MKKKRKSRELRRLGENNEEVSREEIKRRAEKLAKELFEPIRQRYDVDCSACGQANCRSNEQCIKCGCQL